MSSRSTTRTIRIDGDLDQKIEKMAKTERTSVNFVANSAIREYVEWCTVGRKFGIASFPLLLVDKLIQKFNEKECEDLGKWAARETFMPFAEYQFGEITFESFLEVFRRFGKYSGRYKFDDTQNGSQCIIFLKHGSGRRWSHYYNGLLQSIFGEMNTGAIRTELTDDLLVVKIDQAVGKK